MRNISLTDIRGQVGFKLRRVPRPPAEVIGVDAEPLALSWTANVLRFHAESRRQRSYCARNRVRNRLSDAVVALFVVGADRPPSWATLRHLLTIREERVIQ